MKAVTERWRRQRRRLSERQTGSRRKETRGQDPNESRKGGLEILKIEEMERATLFCCGKIRILLLREGERESEKGLSGRVLTAKLRNQVELEPRLRDLPQVSKVRHLLRKVPTPLPHGYLSIHLSLRYFFRGIDHV